MYNQAIDYRGEIKVEQESEHGFPLSFASDQRKTRFQYPFLLPERRQIDAVADIPEPAPHFFLSSSPTEDCRFRPRAAQESKTLNSTDTAFSSNSAYCRDRWTDALSISSPIRLSTMSGLKLRPFFMDHSTTRPSVLMDTRVSPRSTPLFTHCTCFEKSSARPANAQAVMRGRLFPQSYVAWSDSILNVRRNGSKQARLRNQQVSHPGVRARKLPARPGPCACRARCCSPPRPPRNANVTWEIDQLQKGRQRRINFSGRTAMVLHGDGMAV